MGRLQLVKHLGADIVQPDETRLHGQAAPEPRPGVVEQCGSKLLDALGARGDALEGLHLGGKQIPTGLEVCGARHDRGQRAADVMAHDAQQHFLESLIGLALLFPLLAVALHRLGHGVGEALGDQLPLLERKGRPCLRGELQQQITQGAIFTNDRGELEAHSEPLLPVLLGGREDIALRGDDFPCFLVLAQLRDQLP